MSVRTVCICALVAFSLMSAESLACNDSSGECLREAVLGEHACNTMILSVQKSACASSYIVQCIRVDLAGPYIAIGWGGFGAVRTYI